VPALAASEACLQNNRILSTKVVDGSTVLIIDRDKKQYTVHMRGTCVGFDQNAEKLSFRTKTELGCLSKGDSISYNVPGERTPVTVRGSTQTPCVINSVSEGAPPAQRK
jgi:hypothetical protein